MGKQINFYMSETIQLSFIDYLIKNQFVFLDSNSNIVELPKEKNVFSLYLYKQNYGKVIMHYDSEKNVDSIKSPIIQFKKTIIKDESQKVIRGRLWMCDKYSEDEKILKKNEMFTKDYQMLVRWVKKNVPYQKIKKGECWINEYVNDEVKELQDKGFILTI